MLKRTTVVRRRVNFLHLAVIVILSTSMSACVGSGGPAKEAPFDDVSQLITSAQRTMAIETAAENLLLRECMSEAGFEFYVQDPTMVDPGVEDEAIQLLVNEITEDSATLSGYGEYVDSPFFGQPNAELEARDDEEFSATSHSRNNEYFNMLSTIDRQAYLVAFEGGPEGERVTLDDGTGIPAGGCIGAAGDEVLGDQKLTVYETFTSVQSLARQVALEGDPEYDAAFESWQSCMQADGYDFASVSEAISAGVTLRGDSVQPTSGEIDQALTDAKCQLQSDLPSVTESAFSRKQREVLDGSLDLLLTWHDVEEMVLTRSSQVLGITYEPVF